MATTTVEEQLCHSVPGRHADLPETTCGTVRLDLHTGEHTQHWYLTIADQRVEVTRSVAEADLVIGAERAVLDQIAAGELHLSAAFLRNALTARGDLRLMMLLRRLFPGPAGARHPRDAAREGLRR
ncbi:SCP2 sterol-binding domain-containing protein [Micromonospora fluostatini]|uniref:SCP2 sterol-binding domain-containing protein n=1 Tax=Micromonospora sp. JCM 30529 TaxID=3421643 RepID=UPI003D18719B